eukprot:515620_1
MKVYMEQDTRFWEIQTKGKTYTIRYGKVGCDGRELVKSFPSQKECTKQAKGMIRKKENKGYSETTQTKKRKKMDVSDDASESDDEPPTKKRKTSKRRKKKEELSSSESESEASDDSQDIKNEDTLRELLKDSSVLLTNEDDTKEFEVSVNGKSYSYNERKSGRKGRTQTKKLTSKKKAFEAALTVLKSKMRDDWTIVEDEEEEEEEEESESEASDVVMKDKKKKKTEDVTKKKSYKTVKMKQGSAPIDEYCPYQMSGGYSVLEDGGVVYDAMLNQTNIGNNNNKFYKLQIIQKDGRDEFYYHFRWARVGYKGQLKTEPASKEACIAAFKKKFHDKTLNEWEDRHSFEARARKYTYLPMDYSSKNDDNESGMDSEMDEECKIESTLHEDVQDLVKLIFDKNMMEQQMKEIGYDAEKLPLGKVDKSIITQAYQILKDIESEINKGIQSSSEEEEESDDDKKKKRQSKRRKKKTLSSKSKRTVYSEGITDLSSAYYTLIPHEFGFKKPPLIDSEQRLNKEMKLIEALSEIEVASRLLAGDKKNKMEKHPLDKHFDLLKCEMESIPARDKEFKMLQKYVALTHAETHNRYELKVEKAFKIDREGSDTRFKKWAKDENRMLLWHGSRLTNFVGIISQGLRIAPPEAPVTGYMFGKGVYFADMCSKSANYCFTSPANNTGMILLCEVALGKMNKLYHSDYYAGDLPNGKSSTKGVGKTAPNKKTWITTENGCVIPSGKGERDDDLQSSLLYNEYIVYDTAQIKMKYLLKLKFDYGNAGG